MPVADGLHRLQIGGITHAQQFFDLIDKAGREHQVDALIDPFIQLWAIRLQTDFQRIKLLIKQNKILDKSYLNWYILDWT